MKLFNFFLSKINVLGKLIQLNYFFVCSTFSDFLLDLLAFSLVFRATLERVFVCLWACVLYILLDYGLATFLIGVRFNKKLEMTDEDESLVPSVREEIINHFEILSKSFDVL